MKVNPSNRLINTTPVFEVLTEEEIEAIYYSALRVLYETGVRVYNKEGVDLAHSGGAIVEDVQDDSALVKIPPVDGGYGTSDLAPQSDGGRSRPPVSDGTLQEPDILWCLVLTRPSPSIPTQANGGVPRTKM